MTDEIKKDEPAQAGEQLSELEELKKKSEEYLNNWKRAAADMANYRKEEASRAGLIIGYAKESMLFNILPVIDSIYLAATAFGKDGFTPVEKQIQEFLKKGGIEEIAAVGQKFDPNTMEIVEEVDLPAQAGGGESGMVAGELQKGYAMGGKVLRPAKVKVTK